MNGKVEDWKSERYSFCTYYVFLNVSWKANIVGGNRIDMSIQVVHSLHTHRLEEIAIDPAEELTMEVGPAAEAAAEDMKVSEQESVSKCYNTCTHGFMLHSPPSSTTL
jgi:hypothetical protein